MKRLQEISRQLKGILTVSVLRALSVATLSPILALFLKQFVDSDFIVSIIFALSYLIGFFATLFASKVIEALQRRKMMILGLILYSLVVVLFTWTEQSHIIIFLFILYTFLFTILFFGVSLYLDHLSSKSNLGRNFGENGALMNISWIVGPMLGGFIAKQFSFVEVFLLASLFSFIALLVFLFSEPKERKQRIHHHTYIFAHLKTYFHDRYLRTIYLLGLGFSIFYGAIALASLFFSELGSDISKIGLYLGLSGIPWIILEYPIGKWADRTRKEKRLFAATYCILAPSLFFFGLSKNPEVAFIFLVFTSVATALSESSILSHFYRYVPESNIPYSSIFLTYSSLGLFIGTLYMSIALSMTNLRNAYMFLGVLLILFLAVAVKLKNPQKAYGK